jgi:hypothetical protein
MKKYTTHRDFFKPQIERIEELAHVSSHRQPVRQFVNVVSVQFIKKLNVAENVDKITHMPSISGL